MMYSIYFELLVGQRLGKNLSIKNESIIDEINHNEFISQHLIKMSECISKKI